MTRLDETNHINHIPFFLDFSDLGLVQLLVLDRHHSVFGRQEQHLAGGAKVPDNIRSNMNTKCSCIHQMRLHMSGSLFGVALCAACCAGGRMPQSRIKNNSASIVPDGSGGGDSLTTRSDSSPDKLPELEPTNPDGSWRR